MNNTAIGVGERNTRVQTARQDQIRQLSDRLIEAQRSLRILEAIHWQPEIEERFFARRACELPQVTSQIYHRYPLSFDPRAKNRELQELERDICKQLGHANACSQMMVRRSRECRQVVQMLASRGKPAFAAHSRELFGTSAWKSESSGLSLKAFGRLIKGTIANLQLSDRNVGPLHDAERAATILRDSLGRHFGAGVPFRVRVNRRITADASAGGTTIKLRAGATFTEPDLRLLEVHEGWVHLATTLNGRAQPCCTFLRRCTPSATVTQEGLAVLTEILAGTSQPQRLRRLANRIEAIGIAEAGADFLQVYRFFVEEGEQPRAAYQQAQRVFRGSLPSGCGPFTKDLAYSKGLILLLEFLDRAQRTGQIGQATLLFSGKTCVTEIPHLAQLIDEGLIVAPSRVPALFAVPSALELWSRVARAVGRRSRTIFATAG